MTKKLSDIKVASIVATKELLSDIIQNPEKYVSKQHIIVSLKSQGNIAKLEVEHLNITSMSLNTFKEYASRSVEGGFDTIDRLRTSALKSISDFKEKSKASNKATKAGLSKRVKELEGELQQARQDMLLISMLFEQSLIQGKSYAESSDPPSNMERCKHEQRALKDMLSLRKQPIVVIKSNEK